MSGIEIAGLALGAIPVILEAIKGYRNTYEHIRDFKNAAKQMHVIDAQFRVCKLNFLSECRMLLSLVLSDSRLSQEMIADTKHSLWQDTTVEEQLASLLQDNINACTIIVADTAVTIQAFDARLSTLQASRVSNSLSCLAMALLTFIPELHWSDTTSANFGSIHDGEESA